MQKWEYLEIEDHGSRFSVTSAQGDHFKDEDYLLIDPGGKREKYSNQWKPKMENRQFLLALLDRLGFEGWEAVGNVASGDGNWVFMLLKRPVELDGLQRNSG